MVHLAILTISLLTLNTAIATVPPITITNVYDFTCAHPPPNACLPAVGKSDTFGINFFNNATKPIGVKSVFQVIDPDGYTDSIQFQNATLKPGDGNITVDWMPQSEGVYKIQTWLIDPSSIEPVLESNGNSVLVRVLTERAFII